MLGSGRLSQGTLYALGAYVAWGLFPVYWKLLKAVPSAEIIAHRVVWSFLFFYLLLVYRRSARDFWGLLRSPDSLKTVLLSSALIGTNWFVYIYAVNSGRVLEASLGYFVNPLVSVALGTVFFRERLRLSQWLSVALAFAGVLHLALEGSSFPSIGLTLAFSFGVYGFVRKKSRTEPLATSTAEAFIIGVPSFTFLAARFAGLAGATPPAYSAQEAFFLLLGGLVTGVPLLWFVQAGKKLPLSTLGFFQYITPTIQFSLAVFIYGEPFSIVHARCFGLIWLALAIYSLDAAWVRRGGRISWASGKRIA